MAQVKVYTVPGCVDCAAAKYLLREAGIAFEEVDIGETPHAREALELLSGRRSVPQVFVGNRFIGQVAEVRYLIEKGRLDAFTDPSQRPSDPQGAD